MKDENDASDDDKLESGLSYIEDVLVAFGKNFYIMSHNFQWILQVYMRIEKS